jgi:acetyl-CoA C-acetyltransferase
LASAEISPNDLDLVELYSCFPVAVETYAEALGITLDRDITLTGGMPFAGGPYNNYVLQATARAAELLRAAGRGTALVASVSGILTKQGFGLWSMAPAKHGFHHADLSRQVAAACATRPVLERYVGTARVAGYTVLYGRGQTPRALALLDTPDGSRVLAGSEDSQLLSRLEAEEFVGREVGVDDLLFRI